MSQKLYLKQTVAWEPLVNQWYAVPNLLPPVTAALYMGRAHLEIMKSFLKAPDFHADSATKPALAGGPFINYPPARAGEIEALMERTVREQAHLLELGRATLDLRHLLAAEAKGFALEPLYARVPAPLRGYVELTYDIDGQPAVRYLEGLLYRSRYYDESLQGIALCPVQADVRPFVLSTPRLPDEKRLFLKLAFRSAGLDTLASMALCPRDPAAVAEELGLDGEGRERFRGLLSEEPGAVGGSPGLEAGEALRLRYFGHACVMVETRGLRMLIDPFYSYPHGNTAGLARFSSSDLPPVIDYVLITHAHHDHLLLEMLLPLRHRVRRVVVPRTGGGALPDPSLKLLLQRVGFADVVELDDFEAIEAEDARIVSIPFLGEHSDLNIRGKTGYCIQAGGRSAMFLADSNNMEPQLYAHVQREIGDVDVILLGMECVGAPLSWLYAPFLAKPIDRKIDQARRTQGSDSRRALSLVRTFHPRQAHVYAMGQEPWIKHILPADYAENSTQMSESREFVRQCRALGMESEMLYGRKEIRL
jgi:L-ascorbate metabolism protein UlaG (beta-lactamase superfamily)